MGETINPFFDFAQNLITSVSHIHKFLMQVLILIFCLIEYIIQNKVKCTHVRLTYACKLVTSIVLIFFLNNKYFP